MVRAMVGTLVDISLGKLKDGSITDILKAEDRNVAGKTAPACGLTLERLCIIIELVSLNFYWSLIDKLLY